ncbi:MAG: S8 family serine peptidase [Saprospiraceae bacterium]|nr:S8 family serine peptidase [Saprospiraceae bacterium]
MRFSISTVFLLISFTFFSAETKAQISHKSGEILFQTLENQSPESVITAIFGNSFRTKERFSVEKIANNYRIYRFTFDPEQFDEKELLNKFRRVPSVLAAQFNHIVKKRNETPNDSLYRKQWNMAKIGAPSVWSRTTGGTTACGDTIVVAVLDVGFDISHPDLAPNIWKNPLEIPNNNRDDDRNGFIDDFAGVNITTRNDKHALDDHGTQCAGIIGAVGNNQRGVSGVNWNVKLLIMSGLRTESDLVEAYEYALNLRKKFNQTGGREGAFIAVTSASLGFEGNDARPENFPIYCNVFNKLGLEGILNVGSAANTNKDINVLGDIPSLCPSEELIVVTNTTDRDSLSLLSGFSEKHVDIAAPGRDILSTGIRNSYKTDSGTSFAAPLVAGAIALLFSVQEDTLCRLMKKQPILAKQIVKDALWLGVDKLSVLRGKTVTGGRLNLEKSYNLLDTWAQNQLSLLSGSNTVIDKKVNLLIQAPNDTQAEILIMNAVGQVVGQQKIEKKSFLTAEISVNTEGYAAGVYFVVIKSENKFIATRKIVVAR